MNKLEEYRAKVIDANIPPDGMVAYGFDAAMALALPVKFANWRNDMYYNTTYKTYPHLWDKVHFSEYKMKSIESMYKYWITYIYKPE